MIQELRWTPFETLIRREIKRFLKVLAQTVFTPLVNSTLYLLIFGVSLGNSIDLALKIPYLAFLIPGLVMMGCMNNAFQNSASSIVSQKFQGELEDLKVAPISSFQIIWAMSLGGLIRGCVVAFITFAVGEVFYQFSYHEWLAVHHPLILIVFLSLGGLIFANIGIWLGFWAKSFDHMGAITGFIITPLMYLGGVFFSVANLHPFWQSVAHANPMLYLINGVRYGILGVSDVAPERAFLVASAAWLFTYFLALRTLKTASFQRW